MGKGFLSLINSSVNYMDIFKVYSFFLIAMFLIVKYWRNKENIDPKMKPYIKYIKEQCPKLKKILSLSFLISFLIYFYLPVSADVSNNNIENLFKIASSGISILGAFIVAFSVATINSTSNNYSTRILDVFMNKSFFKAYLFLIISSLGFSSIVGAFIPLNSLLSSFLIFFGLILLVSNFIALFFYINEIIKFMKPENIIKNVLDEIKIDNIREYFLKYGLRVFDGDNNHFSKDPLQYLDLVIRKIVDSKDKQVIKYLLEETNKKFLDFENGFYNEYLQSNLIDNYAKLPFYIFDFYYLLLKNPEIKSNGEYTLFLIDNLKNITNEISKREINWNAETAIIFTSNFVLKIELFKNEFFEDYEKFRLIHVFQNLLDIIINMIKSNNLTKTKFELLINAVIKRIGYDFIEMPLEDYYSVGVLRVLVHYEHKLIENNAKKLANFSHLVDYDSIIKYVDKKSPKFSLYGIGLIESAVNYFLIDYVFSETEDYSKNIDGLIRLCFLKCNGLNDYEDYVTYHLTDIKQNEIMNISLNNTPTKLTSTQYAKFLKLYNEFENNIQTLKLTQTKKENVKEADVITINFD